MTSSYTSSDLASIEIHYIARINYTLISMCAQIFPHTFVYF